MLPNLIVIGGAKCGTSSLHYYLSLHPEIFMSRRKELNFFIEEMNWSKGIEWYQAQFENGAKHAIRGESSPQYTRYPIFRGVPERMHRVIPHSRLIYILRDPMERLISHYIDDVLAQGARKDVAQALHPSETNLLVAPSLQGLQLERYLAHYPPSQLLMITAEDLARQRQETLARVFRFLGVDDTFTSSGFALKLNPRAIKRDRNRLGKMVRKIVERHPCRVLPRRLNLLRMIPYRIRLPLRHRALQAFSRPLQPPVLDPGLERTLLEIFHEDAEHLRRLSGLRFEGWCV
jgi:hypothetical protein